MRITCFSWKTSDSRNSLQTAKCFFVFFSDGASELNSFWYGRSQWSGYSIKNASKQQKPLIPPWSCTEWKDAANLHASVETMKASAHKTQQYTHSKSAYCLNSGALTKFTKFSKLRKLDEAVKANIENILASLPPHQRINSKSHRKFARSFFLSRFCFKCFSSAVHQLMVGVFFSHDERRAH